MSRYKYLTPTMRNEILDTCHSWKVYPSELKTYVEEDGEQKCNPFENMMKQYEQGIKFLNDHDVFDVFETESFQEFLRTAPDDVEVYEELESEIVDFLETEIGKMKDLM